MIPPTQLPMSKHKEPTQLHPNEIPLIDRKGNLTEDGKALLAVNEKGKLRTIRTQLQRQHDFYNRED